MRAVFRSFFLSLSALRAVLEFKIACAAKIPQLSERTLTVRTAALFALSSFLCRSFLILLFMYALLFFLIILDGFMEGICSQV
jgi:hypothetical protein